MEFNTVEDAIHFAIEKEEASAQFYRDIAQQVKYPATRIIFEVLSQTELKHKANLELELMKLGKTTPHTSCMVPEQDDETYVEVDEDAAKMSYLDVLQIAIQKERAAFVLYANLMAQATDSQLRKTFLELSEEEMRHLVQFENEYNSVIPKKK